MPKGLNEETKKNMAPTPAEIWATTVPKPAGNVASSKSDALYDSNIGALPIRGPAPLGLEGEWGNLFPSSPPLKTSRPGLMPVQPKGMAVAEASAPGPTTPTPAFPTKPLFTDEGSGGYYSEPTQAQLTLPSSDAIVSRGKFGEPLLTNQPGFEPQVLPTAGRVPGAKKGSLIEAQGRGTVPGGQVITPTMDPETEKLIAARRAEVLPAQESYNRTLDEANIMEGAHGTREAQRARAFIADQRNKRMDEFYKKYGIDLKGMEFQATLPKLAAETGALQAQARKYDAEAKYQGTRSSGTDNEIIRGYNKHIDLLIGQLYNPLLSEDEKAGAEASIQDLNKRIEKERAATQSQGASSSITPAQKNAIMQKVTALKSAKDDAALQNLKNEMTSRGLNPAEYGVS